MNDLQAIADRVEIEALRGEFVDAGMMRDYDRFASLFTQDAVWRIPPDRLEAAAAHAADLGLEVWFSPFTIDLTTKEMLSLLAHCAGRAERLRRQGVQVVLVTGAELSLLNKGFLPPDTLDQRLKLLVEPQRPRQLLPEVPARVNDFLAKAVVTVRERFGGKLTYASIPLENVDWAPSTSSRSTSTARPRSPTGSAGEIVFTFANYALPHRDDPREDLDRASYGIVKVLEDRLGHTYPDVAWEPKAAFTAVASHHHA